MTSEILALPPWFEEGGLLDDTDEAARAALRGAMEQVRFAPGEAIWTWGEPADELLYLVHGEARIYRPDGPDGVPIELARVLGSRTLGETTFVTRGVRTASVEALTAVEAWRLSFEALDRILAEHPSAAVIYRHLAEQLARTSQLGDDERIQAAVEVSIAAKLLVTVIAIQSGTLLLTGLMTELMLQVASTTIMLVGYLAFLSAIGWVYVKQVRLPPRDLGLTLEGWRASLRDSAVVTLAFMAVSTAVKWAIVALVPAYGHVPVFDVLDVTRDHGRGLVAQLEVVGLSALVYALVGGLQELYARGMLQGTLTRIFRPRTDSPWPAIIVSNLLFGSIHVSWSISLMVASFIGGLLWGWLYGRRPTLLGPAVSHIVLGLWVCRVLNLFALFRFGPLALGG